MRQARTHTLAWIDFQNAGHASHSLERPCAGVGYGESSQRKSQMKTLQNRLDNGVFSSRRRRPRRRLGTVAFGKTARAAVRGAGGSTQTRRTICAAKVFSRSVPFLLSIRWSFSFPRSAWERSATALRSDLRSARPLRSLEVVSGGIADRRFAPRGRGAAAERSHAERGNEIRPV